MLNPFDLRGPEFLLFYLLLSVCVMVALVLTRRFAEAGEPTKVNLSDPYQIAFLRGGAPEVARLAATADDDVSHTLNRLVEGSPITDLYGSSPAAVHFVQRNSNISKKLDQFG